jgi:hypothetical protein
MRDDDPADDSAFELILPPEPHAPDEPADPVSRRRADIDAKQALVARVLADLGCEGAILLMPSHVAWFTGGMTSRGLIADTDRPGVYTTGRARWLVCSNTDTRRLFDEELDQLGFQLKEWAWPTGRAVLLGELVAGKTVAADRPFPHLKLINDRLRAELRPLLPFDRERFDELGKTLTHAVEATARGLTPGETEAEIAGQVAHRLCRHGVEPVGLSVTADGRGKVYRRAGYTDARAETACVITATAARHGLHATCSRTVCFGQPAPGFRAEYEAACKLSGVYRLASVPGGSVGMAVESGRAVTAGGTFAEEWRQALPGYGAGWFPAEELRRSGGDEPFRADQPVTWLARVGAAAVADTVVVANGGGACVTPPDGWPYKRLTARGKELEIPDILVR